MTTREKQSFAVPLSDTDRAERLSTLWCIKEAYVKAKGEGIGFGLERIEVTLSADGVVEDVSVDGRQVRETGWKVDVGTVGEVYRWACLWQEGAGDTGLRVETITYKEVIDAIQS
jgi:4'-phosphopantetheinyl transferase